MVVVVKTKCRIPRRAGADFSFITQSTVETNDTVLWEDGIEYPSVTVELSSASHPFYTGTMKIIDTAGRVERFERRYGRRRKDEVSDTQAES
jgi:large subunit ribosomal protein L31